MCLLHFHLLLQQPLIPAEAQQKNSVGKMESTQGLLLMCPALNIAEVVFKYLMCRNTTTNHVSKLLYYFLSNQHTCSNSAQQTGLLTWQNACLANPLLNIQITQEQSPTESLCARRDNGSTDSQFVNVDGGDTAHS